MRYWWGIGRSEEWGELTDSDPVPVVEEQNPHPSPLPVYRERGPAEKAVHRAWVVAVLLGVGVLGWLTVGRGIVDWNQQVAPLICAVVIAAVMIVPAARRIAVELMLAAEKRLENWVGV